MSYPRPSSGGTGTVHTFAAGVPSGSSGAVGDIRTDTNTQIEYEKTGPTTWTARGQLAKNVTNTDANFTCPDTTVRGATVAD